MGWQAKRERGTRYTAWLLVGCVVLSGACQDSPVAARRSVTGPAAPLSATSEGAIGTMPSSFSSANFKTQSLSAVVTESGKISVSADAFGSVTSTGTLDIEKPTGATVRGAYLVSASTGGSLYQIQGTDILLNGQNPTFTSQVASSIGSFNHFADVTAIVKGLIDAAPSGIVAVPYDEGARTFSIDGSSLVVIFDDPAQTSTNTVVVMFGAQTTTGDQFIVSFNNPLDLTDPNLRLQMSLAISYGFQPSPQFSYLDVNGARLSSCAGGQDDGEGANGALITIGGTGDASANPADPNQVNCNPRDDDELYDLIPFAKQGDTQMIVNTLNPSGDDNIHLAIFNLSVRAAINPTFQIDVEPEDPNNVVSLSGRMTVIGALSSPSFDATTIDGSTCRVLGGSEPVRPTSWRIVDVDKDGDKDLFLQFSIKSLINAGALSSSSTSLTVKCGSLVASDAVAPAP